MREQLDSLNDGKLETDDALEVGLLWLTSIFPSRDDYGYDVTDYRIAHPEFGTLRNVNDLTKPLNENSTASNDSTRRS